MNNEIYNKKIEKSRLENELNKLKIELNQIINKIQITKNNLFHLIDEKKTIINDIEERERLWMSEHDDNKRNQIGRDTGSLKTILGQKKWYILREEKELSDCEKQKVKIEINISNLISDISNKQNELSRLENEIRNQPSTSGYKSNSRNM